MRPTDAHRLGGLLTLAVWTCFLPLGAKYVAVLASAIAAAAWLRQRQAQPAAVPTLHASLALLLWLGLSSAWSSAAWRSIVTHLWLYALPLLVPLLGSACPPAWARRAIDHFAALSAAVGLLLVLAHLGVLSELPLLGDTTIDAEGNQRIATSILLALGAGLAAHRGLGAQRLTRLAWLLAAAASLAGLAWQDRRTGMLLLPLLLLAWGLARQPDGWRRLAMAAAVVLAATLAWQAADGVRSRFAEGLQEVQQYASDDHVATSWGQRLRMWQLTGAMVVERPLAGHGVASWLGLWRQRVTPGTALAANTTPHNEYLLLAQQGGVVALALWLWLLLAGLRHALRAGAAGVPALMVWTALAWTGLFNAVLRDAKFSLPLLLLATLAVASARSSN